MSEPALVGYNTIERARTWWHANKGSGNEGWRHLGWVLETYYELLNRHREALAELAKLRGC